MSILGKHLLYKKFKKICLKKGVYVSKKTIKKALMLIKSGEYLKSSDLRALNSQTSTLNVAFEKVFDYLKVSNVEFEIKIKDQLLFTEVFEAYLNEKKYTEREKAALNGDSHKSKCSKNLLSMRNSNKDKFGVFYELPDQSIKPTKKTALIIENLETFIKRDFISTLKIENIEDMNIILGSGASIESPYFFDFLKEYELVYCFFDWDEAGLRFYKTLFENGINAFWHYEERFDNYFNEKSPKRRSINKTDLRALIGETKHLPNIKRTLKLIHDSGMVLEQELFHTKLNIEGEK